MTIDRVEIVSVDGSAVLGLYRHGQRRPPLSPGLSLPRLLGIGQIRRIARASHLGDIGSGEVPNATVEIENADGGWSRYWKHALPYGRRCIIYSGGQQVFSGTIGDVEFGPVAKLTVIAYSLTDLLPLRTTAEWGEYASIAAIPECYGDLSAHPVRCIPYDATRTRWVPSNGLVEVTTVYIDGLPAGGYDAGPVIDAAGKTVTVIRLDAPAPDGTTVTAGVIGHRHPVTGALLDTPDQVIWHVLTQVARRAVSDADLAELRTAAARAGMIVAGQLYNNALTLRGQIDEIADSCGLVWTWGVWTLYPPIDSTATPSIAAALGTGDLMEPDHPALSGRSDDIAGRVTVHYGYRPGDDDYAESLTVGALGRHAGGDGTRTILSKWLRRQQDAADLARRSVERLARLRLSAALAVRRADIGPGQWLTLEHPRLPRTQPQPVFVLSSIYTAPENAISGELLYGPVPKTAILSTGARSPTPDAGGIEVAVENGTVTLTILDPDGEPAPGAYVTLDGGTARVTDSAGRVTFTGVQPNRHIVAWEYADYEPMEMEITT